MTAWGRLGAVALAALLSHEATADAGALHASALNGSGGDPTLERDTRGMSQLVPGRSRSPAGWLYDAPGEPRPGTPLEGGWSRRFSLEAGAIRDGRDAPRLRHYGDYREGAILNYLGFGLEHDATARYLDFTAGAVGRDDQHYRATHGRYGAYRASLYFAETPMQFSDRARTLFLGAGTGSLTLPPGLVPGNNTPAQVAAALEGAPPFELGFTRRKGGLDLDASPSPTLRVYARYAQEQKKGTRPSGGASGFPGATVVETIEPLDYTTHDFTAGMQWTGETLQANVAYSGSLFRNAIDALTWEHPLTVGDPAVVQRARMALDPDNAQHGLRLDFGAPLPLRGRVSGGLSWTRMTQNDALLPHTLNSGLLGATDLANWNTTAALSQPTAGARIDTRLAHAAVSFSPLQDLSLQAKLRHYEQNNRTRYTAFYPLTGELGYLGLDGANNVNIVPGLFRVQVRSIPFEQRKDSYGVEADYRLLRRTSLALGWEREDTRLSHRERARLHEDRVAVSLHNRDLSWANMKLSYEHAKRGGEAYDYNPNAAFYSTASITGAPATLAELRKHDLSDRTQQLVKGRVNFIVAADMDFAVAGRYLDNDYGAGYGSLGDRAAGANLEWSWQPRPGASAWAHYGFERRRVRMASVSDDPAGWASGNPNAGGPAYPLANRWEEESRDDAHTLGAGFRYAFARATLESGWSFHYAPSRNRYAYASAGALAGGAGAAPTAGDAFPDIIFRQQALDTSLRVRLDKHTAVRLFHRYERTRLQDWHYDGVPLLFENGAGVFLGSGPRSYAANMVGVFLQYVPGKGGTEQ